MSKIKQILDTLSIEDQQKLQQAFDNCEPCYILLPTEFDGISTVQYAMRGLWKKRYIGVNVENIPLLREEEKIGEWSLGRVDDA